MGRRSTSRETQRAYLWSREKTAAYRAGRGLLPICNLCDEPVLECDAWHESHYPGSEKWAGGKRTGVAHALCNLAHGRQVTRDRAKVERMRKRHLGLAGPGLGPHPMRAGRFSTESKTFGRGVQKRAPRYGKHARMLERLAVVPAEDAAP